MTEHRKRYLGSSPDSSSSYSETPKRRAVQKKTVQEWISQYDKQFNTAVWLQFDTVDRTHVSTLRCSICSQFQKQLEYMRNFRSSFIDGTTNVRISTVKDHASSDMLCFCTKSTDLATFVTTLQSLDRWPSHLWIPASETERNKNSTYPIWLQRRSWPWLRWHLPVSWKSDTA